VAIEAVRIATKYMTPVILLSDAYLAHAAEPWRLTDLSALPRFPVRFRTDPAGFHPFLRDPATLARAWAVPGTPDLEHRIGGLDVSHVHLRYLIPFPSNLGDLLQRFDRVLVPEMNTGQLVQLLRAAYLVPAEGLNKVEGKPFKVAEIVQAIRGVRPL